MVPLQLCVARAGLRFAWHNRGRAPLKFLNATSPTNAEYASLNLASALQIFAYELRLTALQQPAPAGKTHPPATRDDMELFYAHLEQSMVDLGFLDPQQPKRLMQRMRRLFERARVEREELNILRGLLAVAQDAARKAAKGA